MAGDAVWYYAKEGQTIGPISLDVLRQLLPASDDDETLVFGPGLTDWTAAKSVRALQTPATGAAGTRATSNSKRPPLPGSETLTLEILGEKSAQYAVLTLEPGEEVIALAAHLLYLEPAIHWHELEETAPAAAEIPGWLRWWRRLPNVLPPTRSPACRFINRGAAKAKLALSTAGSGMLASVNLAEHGGALECAEGAVIASSATIHWGELTTRRGIRGRWGTQPQQVRQLVGAGTVLLQGAGGLVSRTLAADESIRLDLDALVANNVGISTTTELIHTGATASIERTFRPALYWTTLTGPGTFWLQTTPCPRDLRRSVGTDSTGRPNS